MNFLFKNFKKFDLFVFLFKKKKKIWFKDVIDRYFIIFFFREKYEDNYKIGFYKVSGFLVFSFII